MVDYSFSTKAQAIHRPTPHRDTPLWTLQQGPHRLHAQLLQHHPQSWEVRLSHDGVFRYSERYPTRARALEEADACRRELEEKGWIAAGPADVSPIDPFQGFEWLQAHYREVAAAPGFSRLSGFERWVLLRGHVRQNHFPNVKSRMDALDGLATPLKPQLLHWLERRREA